MWQQAGEDLKVTWKRVSLSMVLICLSCRRSCFQRYTFIIPVVFYQLSEKVWAVWASTCCSKKLNYIIAECITSSTSAAFPQMHTGQNTIQLAVRRFSLTGCFLPSHLVINAQREVLPLPSHSRTPAAQPRLLSLMHVSERTQIIEHKLSHIKSYLRYQCEQRVLFCVQLQRATLCRIFFFFKPRT